MIHTLRHFRLLYDFHFYFRKHIATYLNTIGSPIALHKSAVRCCQNELKHAGSEKLSKPNSHVGGNWMG